MKDELDAATKDAKQKEEQIAQLITVSEDAKQTEAERAATMLQPAAPAKISPTTSKTPSSTCLASNTAPTSSTKSKAGASAYSKSGSNSGTVEKLTPPKRSMSDGTGKTSSPSKRPKASSKATTSIARGRIDGIQYEQPGRGGRGGGGGGGSRWGGGRRGRGRGSGGNYGAGSAQALGEKSLANVDQKLIELIENEIIVRGAFISLE